MTFNEYQKESIKTAIYPDVGNNYIYPTLGLVGEAGELANTVKKVIRDNNGVISSERCMRLADEIGDVIWYCSQLAYELGLSLDEIALHNLDKLKSRQDRNVLSGSGDNR